VASLAKPSSHLPLVAALFLAGVALYFFPLFRIVPLAPPASSETSSVAPNAFNPVTKAADIWARDLPAAAAQATELPQLITALRTQPDDAKKQFAKSSGLGAAYFFVRGSGKVIKRERNVLHLAIEGAPSEIVALRIGPIFGNTVRDGCGFLDLNNFPGLTEFNALSAELNALVEKNILPSLRERALEGTQITFAGCAPAPEIVPDRGEPLFVIVPVQASVR
jgi:predicted lipoprotein